jgi:hypothetical protein
MKFPQLARLSLTKTGADLAWFLPFPAAKVGHCGRSTRDAPGMFDFAKTFSLGCMLLALASCGANSSLEQKSEPEIFRVGELEVWLYSDRGQMVQNLPPVFSLIAATRIGDSQMQVSGYYDKERKRIYAINDARTVIHEFKHYLEPEWRHAVDDRQDEKKSNQPAAKSNPPVVTAPITKANNPGETSDKREEF